MVNIILYGMRGSGKSTIGRELAKSLNKKFIDLDSYIEKKIGEKLYNYIEKNGWELFRDIENLYLKDLLDKNKKSVISLGGGTIIFERNQDLILNKNHKLIFIDSNLEEIKKRISKDKNKRNSLTGKDLTDELEKIYNERKETYEKFYDLKILNNNSITDCVNEILTSLKVKKLTLPGSKSITNRDLILASLTDGKSILKGFLTSDDTIFMINALKKLGIEIKEKNGDLIVNGGINKISGEGKELFLGNSGTSSRFLTAFSILNKKGEIIIDGDERMKERPIHDLVDGIEQLGVLIESNNGFFPIKIKGGKQIEKNKIKMKGDNSSQYFTALLQIAPVLKNGLEIEVLGDLVSKPYIDITINEMQKFGVDVENNNYKYFKVKNSNYKPVNITIEGDASALSYIACYNSLHGGIIKIKNIGNNSKQGDYKFLDIMKIFGLKYNSNGEETILESPGIKNINLKKFNNLKIDFENMPDISMSFMIMSIFLPGITKITGLKTLNLKECLRIDAMRDELRKFGIKINSDEKSIEIGEFKNCNEKIEIETYDDHRIAMCFGILNTYIGNLKIKNKNCVSKTYPNFWKDLEKLEK